MPAPSAATVAPIQSGGDARAHRNNNFDLMRLGLASTVLLSHSTELLDGNRSRELLTMLFHTISLGELAVDCFFILSGFLITASWQSDPSVLGFLRKRVFRIVPGYVVAFLLSVYVAGALGANSALAFWQSLHPLSLLGQMAVLKAPPAMPTFEGWPYPTVNGALWTIRYEFACYILILLLGAAGLLKRRWPIVVFYAVAVAGFAAFRISRYGDPQRGFIASNTATELMEFLPFFLSGAVIYRSGLYRYRPPFWMVGLAAVVVLAALTNTVTAPIGIASLGAFLLIWFGHLRLNLSTLRKMPDISYGVYLYGWPMQKLVIAYDLAQNPATVFVLSWVLSLLAGFASWRLVEKPALRISKLLVLWRPALS